MDKQKSSIIRLVVVMIILQTISFNLVNSQSCFVEYTVPYALEFQGGGGSETVYVYTYPIECLPDISCPEWMSWSHVGGGELMFFCENNDSGADRWDLIYIGPNGYYIEVYQAAGLSPGAISGNETICYGGVPLNISNYAPASGGTPPYIYSWELSVDGGNTWSNVGVSTVSYTPPSGLIITTQYRRKVTDNAYAFAYSNLAIKTVTAALSGGIISGYQVLCYNNDASTITSSTDAAGGIGSFSYQWQKSEYGGSSWGSWNDISGATSTTYDPSLLTISTKYRRKALNNGGCGTVYSNEITKTVRMNVLGGSISGDQTLCYNADASVISSASLASGGTESFSYQWQKAEHSGGSWGSWSDISGATSSSYDPPNLVITTKYRRRANDNGGCGTTYTNEITKTVRLNVLGGSVSGDQTLCYNENASVISSASMASGGTESFSYQWLKAELNGGSWSSWSSIPGATSSSYDPPNLTITTKYTRVAGDNGGCGTAYSEEIVKTVRLNVLAGSITGDQTLCYNTDASVISSASLASGGTESFSYQWQKAEYSGGSWSWSDISGATSSAYDPSNLIITTKYRRRANDNGGCGVVYSNEVTKTIRPNVLGGSISGDQTLCYNADASVISSASLASGGTESFSYQWQKAEYSGGSWSWSDISGATSSAYDPSNLIITTKYRRRANDNGGCGVVYSNEVTKTIRPNVLGGSISGDQTLCYNADASVISSASLASGGTESFNYQWQKAEYSGSNWGSWSDISGATSNAFDPANLTITTKYRRVVTDLGGCGVVNSNEITKTVFPSISAGSISGDQTLTYNEEAALISSINPSSGGSGVLAYHWQKSELSGSSWSSWSSISGASSQDYEPPRMTIATRFRRGVTDTNGCGVEYSDYVTIQIGGMIAPDKTRNYISVFEPRIGIQDTGGVRSTSISRIGVKYFDGLGRPLQDIAVAHNGDIDLITPHTYDQYGRESVNYLPVPVSGNSGQFVNGILSAHETHYNNKFSDVNGFAVTVFEKSPLNRVLKQGAPGATWQPSETGNDRTLKYDYRANAEQEVLIWFVDNQNRCVNTGGEVLSGRSYYPAGTLYKSVIKDENWVAQGNPLLHTTEEFTNMKGQVVLKRSYVANGSNVDTLSTYYVYDYFDLLRYVLSPKASTNLGSVTIFSRDNDLIKGLCYYYEYDARKRMVEKQLPGADPVYMVYDKRDRLVLVQDGKLRDENDKKWLFTKYDMLNRPVLSGVLTHNSISSRTLMQAVVDTIYLDPLRKAYVERNISNTQHLGYENESFPNSTNDGTILYYTATYYDSYDFPDSSAFDLDNNVSEYLDPVTAIKYNERVKGLVTGSKTVVLGTSTFITTTNYYDDKYRPIQAISDLYVGSGGRAVSSTNYDFTGNPLQIRQNHIFQGSGSTMTDTYFAYDNYGRLLTTEHQINGAPPRLLLSETTYNEIGQMVGKGLHKQGTDFLQDIDYEYNIRGWLTAINNPNNLGDDLFSMRLYYNEISALSPLASSAQFNGNISGILWNRQTDGGGSNTLKSSYSYLYDELNRISNSHYGEDTGSGLIALQKYREYDYSYDLNGNIGAMKRTGTTGNIIDNLSYEYKENGQSLDYSNKLFKVTDSSQSTSGFKDGSNQLDDYEYDENGNLKKDLNKGITSITYNFLNLPEQITMNGGTIRYYYDATGRKVSKVVTEGVNTTVRSYEGGFEYEDGLLSIIHTGEGFVDNTSTGYVYNYYLKDHLGNTRAVFSPGTGGTITLNETIDYYPFGFAHVPSYGTGYTKYKYNGKEIQDDLIGGVALDWYDYGARFYDPQIGRWHVIDPHAEKYVVLSPYNYVYNNPINAFDLDGRDGKLVIDGNNLIVKVTLNYSQESLNRYNENLGEYTQEQFKNDFTNYYSSANGSYTIDGEDYNVSFEIQFNVFENESDMPSPRSRDGSTNLTFVSEETGAGSHLNNTIALHSSPRGMAGAEDTGGTLSHEIAHALGAPDTKEASSGKLSSYSRNRSLQPSEVSTMLTPAIKYAKENSITQGSVLITHSRPKTGREDPIELKK